jgi:sirohydrochlorin ferrochelatase
MMTAILLIAHGSRNADANTDTAALAAALAQRYPIAVAAYLELAAPDIDAGGAECVACGATRVILLPHFLSAGIHVRRDLTAARDRLAQRFPQVEFLLAEPIGMHPLLIEVLAQRAAGVNPHDLPPSERDESRKKRIN